VNEGKTRRSWAAFEAEVPEFAAFVRERIEAHKHRMLATLRADGSPRISGIEVTISGGELWIGGIDGSRKFDDMRRDPRVAIHSGSDDPPLFRGDARLSGHAVQIDDEALKAAFMEAAGGGPPGPFELFKLEIGEASTIRESDTHDFLVIEFWRPGEPVKRLERY
jgi:Pyridoxamine 5'-phosphate oxidase